MKIVFMGTPDFAIPILKALTEKHQVICVYTQPPKPAGRGHKLTPSPIHALADTLNIPVRCPVSLKSQEVQKDFSDLNADVAVVAAYGLLLPKPILKAFPKGCINVHASLLPRWRGAAPIQRAILAGDTISGITIMQMEEGLDTGDMFLLKEVPIEKQETSETLLQKLALTGAQAILQVLDTNPIPIPQDEKKATYAHKIKKEEGFIDWNKSAEEIDRQIRAIPSWFVYKAQKIKIKKASVLSDNENNKPATVFLKGHAIAAKKGAILLNTLQREGRQAMNIDAFLRGFNISEGDNVSL